MNNNFFSRDEFFLGSHAFTDDEVLLKFQFKVFNAVVLLTMIFSLLFAILGRLELQDIGNKQIVSNFTIAIISILVLFLLRKSKKNYKIISYVFYLVSFINCCLAIVYAEGDEFRMIWLYLLIVSVYITSTVGVGDFFSFASMLFIIFINQVQELYLSSETIVSAVIGLVILYLLLRTYTMKIIEFESEVVKKNKFIVEELEGRVKNEVQKNLIHEKTLIEQSKKVQMGEMIAMISHQWKQPISTISIISSNTQIKLSLGILELKEDAQNFILEQCDKIDKMIQVMNKTMDDFRNFYKADKKYVSSSLDTIIRKSLDIVEPVIKSKNIEIFQELNSSKEINIYENELIQVVINLLKNSYDNSILKNLNNQSIKIITNDNIIKIIDHGGGIPEDIKCKIFESYFSTKDDSDGSGLGLYMSKIIVEEHHKGKIEAFNTEDGVCFIIEISTDLSN